MSKSKTQRYADILVNFAGESDSIGDFEKKAGVFAEVLKNRGEAHFFPKILREFERRVGKISREASIISAAEISNEARNALRGALKEKGFELKEITEPGILGGIAVRLGDDYLIDGTVKGRLKRLKQSILNLT